MDKGDETADNTDDTPFDTKLDGGCVYTEDAVPEQDGFCQDQEKQDAEIPHTQRKTDRGIWPQKKEIHDHIQGFGNGRYEKEL